jgi:hypothetical protein
MRLSPEGCVGDDKGKPGLAQRQNGTYTALGWPATRMAWWWWAADGAYFGVHAGEWSALACGLRQRCPPPRNGNIPLQSEVKYII